MHVHAANAYRLTGQFRGRQSGAISHNRAGPKMSGQQVGEQVPTDRWRE